MSRLIRRRAFLGNCALAGGVLFVGGMAWRPLKAAEEAGWPKLPAAKIYVVYVGLAGAWPKPDFDAPAEVAKFQKHLDELKQRMGDVEFLGGELIPNRDAAAAEIVPKLAGADALLIVHLAFGSGRPLLKLVDAGLPTAIFSQPFSGHDCGDRLPVTDHRSTITNPKQRRFPMPNAQPSLPNGGKTRRDFLRVSAAGAATVAGLSIARSAHAAGDEMVKIGMIGCGGRCSGAASESLSAGSYVKLVAMYDVFDDRVRRSRKVLKDRFPDQVQVDDDHCFSDFKGYQKVIDSVDVVLIACASKFHPMYAEAAIKAGKPVFVEKPHAIDPVGCRRMQAVCDLAKEKGLSIVSGLQSRFHAGFQETVKRIHDGAIGDIVAMQSMFLRGPYQTVARNPAYTETQYQFSNWYHFCWLSGDDVPQSLVHNMDRVAWIMKEEMPTWCFGLAGRSTSNEEVHGDMFDHHTVVYEYASGTRVYALCQTRNGCYGNGSDIVMGTKGVCHLGACKIEGENPWTFPGPGNNPYQAEQKALIDSVREGKPINSGYHMANSTMSTVMGQLACYSGKPTKWDEVVKSDFQFGPSPDEASFDTPPPVKPDANGTYPLPVPGFWNWKA